jgi:hypothetical protein
MKSVDRLPYHLSVPEPEVFPMLRRTMLGLSAAIALVACAQPVSAWNATGHMMVARQAWDEMTPDARGKATAILKQLPHHETLLERMPPGYADPDGYAFMQAAVWADNIRSNNHPAHAEHRSHWHYVNYPVNPEKVEGARDPAETWDGTSDPANILQALAKNRKELADPNTPPDRRAVALCWVLHLIGDIHQPLHATALFGQQFPAGDKGGNSFVVKGPFGQTNLHSLWDNMLGITRTPDAVDKTLAGLRANPELSRAAMADDLAKKDPKDWAMESFELARTHAYENAQLAGASSELLRSDKSVEVPPLPVGYMERAQAVAGRRVILAGYRMADAVTEAVGK